MLAAPDPVDQWDGRTNGCWVRRMCPLSAGPSFNHLEVPKVVCVGGRFAPAALGPSPVHRPTTRRRIPGSTSAPRHYQSTRRFKGLKGAEPLKIAAEDAGGEVSGPLSGLNLHEPTAHMPHDIPNVSLCKTAVASTTLAVVVPSSIPTEPFTTGSGNMGRAL